MNSQILVLNGGSSSIRFALYEAEETLQPALHGRLDRIGLGGSRLTFRSSADAQAEELQLEAPDYPTAIHFLVGWLGKQGVLTSVKAIGHRVVHGMKHSAPELITPALLKELRRIRPYDPEHLPGEIKLIEAFRKHHPGLLQVACFDTAFHRTMPRVAQILPIPRHYASQGLQRYGFHGLSYAYLIEELARLGDPAATTGRVILAHLGNGASMAALRDGCSIDTSMGFTPTSGLVMSTRSGDLDPGLFTYLVGNKKATVPQFHNMVNHQSGLLGISETSSDMRDLLERETDDVRAAEAVELFCYQAKKWIGSFSAALGGLDTLVFAGGIGENCPSIRRRICEGLEFLGVNLDNRSNKKNAPLVSAKTSRVAVRVIPTDEELMIARSVMRLLEA